MSVWVSMEKGGCMKVCIVRSAVRVCEVCGIMRMRKMRKMRGGGRHNLHSEEDFNAGGRIADTVVLGRFE